MQIRDTDWPWFVGKMAYGHGTDAKFNQVWLSCSPKKIHEKDFVLGSAWFLVI